MEPFDLVVVGAGPGGYVAALRAAQLGLKVACVERESALGGTCLRVGCIPSKALLESSEHFVRAYKELARHGVKTGPVTLDLPAMMRRKASVVAALTKGIDGLFAKAKVTRVQGHARLDGPGRVVVGERVLTAPRILLATGSLPASLPGLTLDGERVLTSTEALSLPEVPERLVVIGAGAIGLELGSVWSRLGAKVTVLEARAQILPGMDSELAAELAKSLTRQGLTLRTGVMVQGALVSGDEVTLTLADGETLLAARVLVAVGRRPNTDDLGLETVGLALNSRGFIPIDAHFATAVPGLYAIGDVCGGPLLAHKAEEEGIACVEGMVTGIAHPVDPLTIPAVVYTAPELASVGLTEDALLAQGRPYRKGAFPFMANGRARALNQTEGQVKVLADAHTDRLLGVHILGPHAGELIAEAAVSMAFGASAEDLARACHAHPTLAEAIKEAALAVDGRALHL